MPHWSPAWMTASTFLGRAPAEWQAQNMGGAVVQIFAFTAFFYMCNSVIAWPAEPLLGVGYLCVGA
eukprot:CAMPEP_0179155036 /NCGR_PEP_ID=MMETSP0796-20121207/75496_1 /TAXON_ID=73915 /ORGANISM="Pyrodinium bahamense, Strain pbaha01" /LENGTH=65 /DNA_ID=CAMNT_0020856481 /DNA_START=20 /DNA_END=213 /DNA_ORIENTATION=+